MAEGVRFLLSLGFLIAALMVAVGMILALSQEYMVRVENAAWEERLNASSLLGSWIILCAMGGITAVLLGAVAVLSAR